MKKLQKRQWFLMQTWTPTVSIITVCLRYIASFPNFYLHLKLLDLMKYDKHTMLAKHCLSATSRSSNLTYGGR